MRRYSPARSTSPLASRRPPLPTERRPIRCDSSGGYPHLSAVRWCSRPTLGMCTFDFATRRGQQRGTRPWRSRSVDSRSHLRPTFMTSGQPGLSTPDAYRSGSLAPSYGCASVHCSDDRGHCSRQRAGARPGPGIRIVSRGLTNSALKLPGAAQGFWSGIRSLLCRGLVFHKLGFQIALRYGDEMKRRGQCLDGQRAGWRGCLFHEDLQ